MTPDPVILLDLGWDVTGVALATLGANGPRFQLTALRPAKGMSPKSLNDKRASARFGDHAERLTAKIMSFFVAASDVISDIDANGFPVRRCMVAAEVPTMGALSAGSMRAMAGALACYRSAMIGCSMFHAHAMIHTEVHRYDVLAGAFGGKVPKAPAGTKESSKWQKRATRERLLQEFGPAAFTMSKELAEDRDAQEDAYDAAAVIYALRQTDFLRVHAGWGDF